MLLTFGVGGLVAAVASVVNGWLAAGYAGLVCAAIVMVLCAGEFLRSRWAGLMFWFGAALGAAVAQLIVIWAQIGVDDLAYTTATCGALGAVLGMLPGGVAADIWRERHSAHAPR